LDSPKCIHKGFLKLNLIQDNNLDNNPSFHNSLQYKAIIKRIAKATTLWNGSIKSLIQEQQE
jgi:hypothetical protein